MAKIDYLIRKAVDMEASDLHVGSWDKYYMRIHGKLVPVADGDIPRELAVDDKTSILTELLNDDQKRELEAKHGLDFSYTIPSIDNWRVRVNYYQQNRGGTDAVFRIIPAQIPTLKDLGFPASVIKMMQMHQGLILVTGPQGSGKTTTLAAMVDEINRHSTDHIITIEDPIEYVHMNKASIVTQREIGTHTNTFAETLRVALREDPDVIVVGEMRDLETISMALTCAETGHLVLGTLSTRNATSTIDRIIDAFPPNSQEQVRVMIADTLRGVISQQLIPTADFQTRVMALEIVTGSPTLSSLIREKKTFNIPNYIQTGKGRFGTQTMDDSILALYKKNIIDWETTLLYCHDPQAIKDHEGNAK